MSGQAARDDGPLPFERDARSDAAAHAAGADPDVWNTVHTLHQLRWPATIIAADGRTATGHIIGIDEDGFSIDTGGRHFAWGATTRVEATP